MKFCGLVYSSDLDNFFTLKEKDKLIYFYLQRNLAKKFSKYLQNGVFISIDVEDEKSLHKGINCYVVSHFLEISNRKYGDNKIYYSINSFRDGIKDLLDNLNNTVFIDFEFNMQDFYPINNFVSEIIEAGYCVCDPNLNVIEERSMYLLPTKVKKITKRTIKFLKYKESQMKNRLSYKEFYFSFKNLVKKYDPHFIVWGKSDIDLLKQSFQINKVPPINFKFIDLSQIHVNYYNLKNVPGLFKTAEAYNNVELPKQKHDALEDALMTKLVFSNFKETIK
ncbi:MAG: exonuclease domain-containing protein [bacterium]